MNLALVIPCYNEEAVLPISHPALTEKLTSLIDCGKISPQSRIFYVDDGSRDATWDRICEFHRESRQVIGIRLTRNRGHQAALLAGLQTAAARGFDAAISLDADLQDDISVIDEMIALHAQGNEIVYGVRKRRDCDSAFKKATALGFYRLMHFFGVELVYNHADFRLMSRRAIESLNQFPEVNLFLRGLVPLIGYRTASVYYDRKSREAGESKYPLKKMLAFALEGITSFTVKPLRMILTFGIVLLLLSLIALIPLLIMQIGGEIKTLLPWILLSVFMIGGLQLTALGTLGEYIGKIYLETKHRPHYLIEQTLPDRDDKIITENEPDTRKPTSDPSFPPPHAKENP